jgi:hypothetical protein
MDPPPRRNIRPNARPPVPGLRGVPPRQGEAAAAVSPVKVRARRLPHNAPATRKGRKPNWAYIAACLALMACFFLPWFSTDQGSVLGYEIAYWVPRYLQPRFPAHWIVLASNSLWAFAFVGVFAFFGLGKELSSLRNRKNPWVVRLLTALSPVVAFVFVFTAFALSASAEIGFLVRQLKPSDSPEVAVGIFGLLLLLLMYSSWGLWLMFFGGVLSGVSVFWHPGRSRRAPIAQPADVTSGANP